MGIHLEHNKAKCFKCEEFKSPIDLLMDLEKFEIISEAFKFLSIQQEYDAYESRSIIKPREYKQVELPLGFNLISMGDHAIARAARHYMKKRGFSIDRLASQGVGYCDEGEYFGYIVFPFYRKGELVYYQGRLFMGVGSKMKNPKDEEFGIGKSQVIFNQDALYIYEKIYAVESITNSLTMGDRGVAMQGKFVSEWQLSQLIMSPCEQLVIILDPDAMDKAIELGLKICNHKDVKVVKLPDSVDVNDLGRKKTLSFVKKTKWQRYMDLYRLKLNLNGTQTEHTHHGRGPNYVDRRGL